MIILIGGLGTMGFVLIVFSLITISIHKPNFLKYYFQNRTIVLCECLAGERGTSGRGGLCVLSKPNVMVHHCHCTN